MLATCGALTRVVSLIIAVVALCQPAASDD
jgi:hypothetical protein